MKNAMESKTIIVNLIAIAAILAQQFTGEIISAEEQLVLLGAANIVLRVFTSEAITLPKMLQKR